MCSGPRRLVYRVAGACSLGLARWCGAGLAGLAAAMEAAAGGERWGCFRAFQRATRRGDLEGVAWTLARREVFEALRALRIARPRRRLLAAAASARTSRARGAHGRGAVACARRVDGIGSRPVGPAHRQVAVFLFRCVRGLAVARTRPSHTSRPLRVGQSVRLFGWGIVTLGRGFQHLAVRELWPRFGP